MAYFKPVQVLFTVIAHLDGLKQYYVVSIYLLIILIQAQQNHLESPHFTPHLPATVIFNTPVQSFLLHTTSNKGDGVKVFETVISGGCFPYLLRCWK